MPSYVLPTLQLGSRGENVRKLQQYLNQLGQRIATDAIFGPETRQAVINFQAQSGARPIDGIVGPRTWEAIEANLGINVDVDLEGGGGAAPLPEIPDAGEPGSWFTPGKVGVGLLVGLGLAAVFGKSKKKR